MSWLKNATIQCKWKKYNRYKYSLMIFLPLKILGSFTSDLSELASKTFLSFSFNLSPRDENLPGINCIMKKYFQSRITAKKISFCLLIPTQFCFMLRKDCVGNIISTGKLIKVITGVQRSVHLLNKIRSCNNTLVRQTNLICWRCWK